MPSRHQVAGAARTRRVGVAPHLVLPARDVAAVIEAGPRAVTIAGPKGSQACSWSRIHCGGWVGRGRHCHKGGIGGDVVGPIVTVAARALHMDATDLVLRQAQHLGERRAGRVDALRMRPYC